MEEFMQETFKTFIKFYVTEYYGDKKESRFIVYAENREEILDKLKVLVEGPDHHFRID